MEEDSHSERNVEPRRLNLRLFAAVACAIIIAGGLAALSFVDRSTSSQPAQMAAGPRAVTVDVVPAAPAVLREDVNENAVVLPKPLATVVPNNVGWLEVMRLRPGQHVRIGQPAAMLKQVSYTSSPAAIQYSAALASFGKAKAQLAGATNRLQSAQASAAAAEARLQQARDELLAAQSDQNKAETELAAAVKQLQASTSAADNTQRMYKDGLISRMEMEAAQSDKSNAAARRERAVDGNETAQAQTKVASDKLTAEASAAQRAREDATKAQQQADDLKRQLDEKGLALGKAFSAAQTAERGETRIEVACPADGIVTRVMAEPGALVTPGVPIAELKPVSMGLVAFDATDDQAARLRAGMQAQVWVKGLSKPLIGRLRAIPYMPTGGTKRNRVFIETSDPAKRLKPGGNVLVNISVRKVVASAVPDAAVDTSAGRARVWVIADGLASSKEVTAAAVKDGKALLTTGPKPGEMVIVSSSKPLREGLPVVWP